MDKTLNETKLEAMIASVEKMVSRKRFGRLLITRVIRAGTITLNAKPQYKNSRGAN